MIGWLDGTLFGVRSLQGMLGLSYETFGGSGGSKSPIAVDILFAFYMSGEKIAVGHAAICWGRGSHAKRNEQATIGIAKLAKLDSVLASCHVALPQEDSPKESMAGGLPSGCF